MVKIRVGMLLIVSFAPFSVPFFRGITKHDVEANLPHKITLLRKEKILKKAISFVKKETKKN